MKRKFIAWLISFAMIFSAVVNIPAKVNAGGGVDIANFTLSLNDTSSVNATWDKNAQTLTVKGNGKIDMNKWVELARKFSGNHYKDSSNFAWSTNSHFTLNIADNTVKLPDVAVYVKDGYDHGFFDSFQGTIIINEDIDTSNVTNMSSMFSKATNTNPDVSKWDTSNVTDMAFMFHEAINANPDVSKWNTSNVTNMRSMFYKATNANPNVSKWNISNVTDIKNMFASSSAVELDLSNWDVGKITENGSVFRDISKLQFLSFKGLPKGHKLTAFAGKYKVDVLNADGTVLKTEGPFEKNHEYEFKENTGYRVYLEEKIQRIFGNDRYETAVKLSQSLTNKSEKVFIASGISMIDALNVGPYAGRFKAPVLLTKTNEIDEKTLDEIQRITATEAIIIGGVNAVSENVENKLKEKGLSVRRLFGVDRYETALKVSEEALNSGVLKSNNIFLCSGISPADALSIASVAAKEKGIILLTDGNTLIKGVEDIIKTGFSTDVKIVGGTAVISSNLEDNIKTFGKNTERIFGNNRYETSVKVYEKYYKPMGVRSIYLANGLTMADALTGAGVVYNFETGLLLTSANEMISPMKEIVKEMRILRILGGKAVINDNIWE